MEFTAKQIAELTQGQIEGDSEIRVSTPAKIEEAGPGDLAFLDNEKYIPFLYNTRASIVIINDSFQAEEAIPKDTTLIRVPQARMAFAQLLEAYASMKPKRAGISPHAYVSDQAEIAEDVYIGEGAIVGAGSKIGKACAIYPGVIIGNNVRMGESNTLYAGVKMYDDCKVGSHCTIHSGAVIGSDGFGFQPSSANEYKKVVHLGNVILEDHVEIGANSTIDRGTLGSTIIRKGVKLDNLIQVAHNVDIGENTVIAAQSGIAGSTTIGKNCMIGGQVGIIGHLKIADGTIIAAQSGIGQDIKQENSIMQGSPAFGIGDYKRSYVLFRSLPKIKVELNELRKQLKSRDE